MLRLWSRGDMNRARWPRTRGHFCRTAEPRSLLKRPAHFTETSSPPTDYPVMSVQDPHFAVFLDPHELFQPIKRLYALQNHRKFDVLALWLFGSLNGEKEPIQRAKEPDDKSC